jgi:crossover junction endodeoxyribonuclease RusA
MWVVAVMKDPTLPLTSNPPTSYRIEIPRGGREWVTANQRGGWQPRARGTRLWRAAAGWKAKQLGGLSITGGARVICELRFFGKRRRDGANWADTAKAVIDGFVDSGVFPDDSAEYVIGPDMRIGPLVAAPRIEALIVHIFPEQESTDG